MSGLVPFNRRMSELMNAGFGDLYSMFDDFFADGFPIGRGLARGTFKVDIHEDNKNYYISAELPGVSKEEINITLDEGRLQIAVIRDESIEKEQKNYVHRERRYCSMQRNLFLPDADSKDIKAKMNNGVLEMVVPKKERPDRSIKIDIE